MPLHIDVLGRLHVLLGAFAALVGVSLGILAVGLDGGLADLGMSGAAGTAGVWLLALCGATLVAGGVALVATGRALMRRRRLGRLWALALAVPDLLVVPFGTALSVYAFWVLLNDEARQAFGRPPRSGPRLATPERS
jgi:hypothetical protein